MTKIFSFALVFALAFSFASVALAQVPTTGVGTLPATGSDLGSGVGTDIPITDTASMVSIIINLVNWVAWVVGLLAVLMGLYAGILFITAGGNAETVTKARNILLYAIVGIAVAVLAFSLVAISKAFLVV